MSTDEPASVVASHDRSGDEPTRAWARRRVTIELGAAVTMLVLATALRWVDATTPHVLPQLQAILPVVVPPAAAFVGVLAVAGRRWRAAVVAGLVVAFHVALLVPWWVAGDHAMAEVDDRALTVLSSNLQYGRADAHDLMATVRRLDVDVLILLELTDGGYRRLRAAGLGAQFAHAVGMTRDDAGGAAVLSRYPLEHEGVPDPPPLTFAAPAVRVASPLGDVVVLAAHPVPPLGPQVRVWRRELAAVSRWTRTVPRDTPVIVAGDLNATDAHPALRELRDTGLADAHRQIGAGPPATWPALGPDARLPALFHLDRVLVRGLGVTRAGVVEVPGSDHRAVWATLRSTDSRPRVDERRRIRDDDSLVQR